MKEYPAFIDICSRTYSIAAPENAELHDAGYTRTRGGSPICLPYGIWGPSPTPRHSTNGLRGRDSQFGCGVAMRHSQSVQIPFSFQNTKHSPLLTYEISTRIQLRDSSNSHECSTTVIIQVIPNIHELAFEPGSSFYFETNQSC